MAIPDRIDVNGDYKRFFGGKSKEWDRRGAFQLYLLKQLGLKPESRLLDVGCGPLCGGVHVIPYLEAGNYCGMDPHQDLVTIAHRVIRERDLERKNPVVRRDFDFTGGFDFAFALSVPMKNTIDLRLHSVSKLMNPGGKFYITHARWFKSVEGSCWNQRWFKEQNDVEIGADFQERWGSLANHIFPMVELTYA